MTLYEIINHQWAIIETMYNAWQIDASHDESDYNITQLPSTTYSEIVKREVNECDNQKSIAKLIEYGGVIDADNDDIIVYEGTVGGEWCRIYIPTYWD